MGQNKGGERDKHALTLPTPTKSRPKCSESIGAGRVVAPAWLFRGAEMAYDEARCG